MKLEFKKIEIDDIGAMMPYYTMRRNNTCDSVFLESFIWKDFYNVRYAIWENKAILWLMEYNGRCFSAMPLCKEEDLPGAFHAIERYFNEELGYPLVINLADEYAVEYLKLPEDKYFVEEQADSRDYLYTGDAMRSLSGKKLHKKKNHVNSFMRQYEGRYEYRALCCSDSHYVWQFLDRWREGKGDEVEEHLDYEVKGIHDILKNCSSLNIRMGGVFIDGELEAFTMGSYNPIENMAVIHIEKANPEINGLYQFINREFLLEEFPDVDWVNREDDLGLEGLRKAKMSYYPADFARKYLVEQIIDGKRGFKWAEDIGNTMSGEELVYLEGEDKQETRRLWHDCFPEDSKEFIEYYYTEKVKDNRLLIKKLNGIIVSMAHLNPYHLRVKNREWDTAYIVGVATEEIHRHQGYMREILKKMMNDMCAAKIPFTFLMPAAEAIYLPFDFTTVYQKKGWKLKEEAEKALHRVICKATEEDCGKAAAWMNQWLSERFEVYCERSADYVARLLKELESEAGELEFLYDGERLVGMQAFWGLKNQEERLLYAEEKYLEGIVLEGGGMESEPTQELEPVQVTEQPMHQSAIMVRITNLEALLSAFALAEGEAERVIEMQVEDAWIEENAGRYRLTLNASGLEVERLAKTKEAEAMPAVDADMEEGLQAAELGDGRAGIWTVKIRDLTAWLFGWKKPEELWPEADAELLAGLQAVDTVKGIWLDEVV